MPKIIINEEDNTLPGLSEYTNFSVVVPGFCGNEEIESGIFDENGIYEVSSQKDFIDNIGAIDAFGFSTRLFATAEPINPGTEEHPNIGIERYRRELTPKEFYSDFAGTLYTTTQLPIEGQPPADEGKDWLYIPVTSGNVTTDTYYKLTKVSSTATQVSGQAYLVVKSGNEGHDLVENKHYGNQIAYELLGLGYPVLFKKLEGFSSTASSWDDFFDPLKDKSTYDFRFIISGYLNPEDDCSKAMAKLATARGDCTALLDIPEKEYVSAKTINEAVSSIRTAANKISDADKYSAFTVPSICYDITYASKLKYTNQWFPGSFHYLACFAHSVKDLNFAEWYAAAGLTRGVSKYAIKGTSYKFGENVVNELEPRSRANGLLHSINVIAKFRDNYLLWGNRTAHQLEVDSDLVASHFLNIRQLCTTLKKELYITCRRFTFDPNSDVLWVNFCNTIKPVLEKMKADQGIDNYEIIKVEAKQKALLKARVRIVPIEAVEDFEITVALEDSLGDTTVSISE